MTFAEAFEKMKEGHKVRRCGWEGFWYWNPKDRTIMLQCHSEQYGNDLIDFRKVKDFEHTIENIMADDWEVVHETKTLTFGDAIEAMKHGQKVKRLGWNGKDMFIFIADDIDLYTDADLSCVSHLHGNLTLPTIVMKTQDDKFCAGWLASQTDMLSDDWIVVD